MKTIDVHMYWRVYYTFLPDHPVDIATEPHLELYYNGPLGQVQMAGYSTPVPAVKTDSSYWTSLKNFFVPTRQAFTTKNIDGVSEVSNLIL